MSRIYEALQRSGGRIAELVLPVTEGKPQPSNGEARSSIPPGPAEELTGGPITELERVAVEQVDIVPAARLVFHTDPRGAGADRFRFLRMRLRELQAMGKLRTVLITSPRPGDGKSTVALNLATALAEGGKRTVLLIEADYYHPTIGRALGLQSGRGLAECLDDHLDPILALRRFEPLGWYWLPPGKTGRNPTELLQSESLAGVVQKLSGLFDWVLIDTPPVLPLADALSLSRHADGSLLVVRADQTPREAIEDAITLLGRKQMLGIVLNGAEGLNRLYSKYYGYYGSKRPAPAGEHVTV